MNTYAYDPYGATTASSGSTANVFGYGGQQLDIATGLYKMGQRYYDPGLARWSAQDLFAGGLSSPQSFNRYSSVLGNPISLLDATGLDCNAFCGLGGAFHQTVQHAPCVKETLAGGTGTAVISLVLASPEGVPVAFLAGATGGLVVCTIFGV